VKTVGLFAAQSLFLWMFLAADPLEQLADAGAFASGVPTRADAYAFAAAWRHGMAGNSPLYMPGFFAVAVATWTWSEGGTLTRRASRVLSAGIALVAAIGVALAAAWLQPAIVVAAFEPHLSLASSSVVSVPRRSALMIGLYTLATWSSFVVGSRLALERRSFVPLAPALPLTVGLVAIRPWTVDDFATTWGRGALDGHPVAVGSCLAVALVSWFLVSRERQRRSQRVRSEAISRT